MYDTTDGLKAGILKDVNISYSDGINPWCIQPDTCKILLNSTPYCCDKCSRRDEYKAGEKDGGQADNKAGEVCTRTI